MPKHQSPIAIPLLLASLFPLTGARTTPGIVSRIEIPPHIVLVVVDSLRRDHLGVFGYARGTSPAIDRLAREGVLFRDVAASSTQTGPAIASLMTGLFPRGHGIQFYSFNQAYDLVDTAVFPNPNPKASLLADRLRGQGYHTVGLVENPWLKPGGGFDRGFDRYDLIGSWDGRFVVDRFREALRERPLDRPFFVYLHLMDTHAPYYNPADPRAAPLRLPVFGNLLVPDLPADELDYVLSLYDRRVTAVDEMIADIEGGLRSAGLRDRTALVITADHGEEFFEHGGLGHGTSLYEEQVRSFVIFSLPSRPAGREIASGIRSVDLPVTLLDLAGTGFEGVPDGVSLLPTLRGGPPPGPARVLHELGDQKAIRKDGWKYITDVFLGTEELYDLGHDPGETRNLADRESRRRRDLRSELLREVAHSIPAPGRRRESTARVTPEMARRLTSLGYLAGGAPPAGADGLEALLAPVSDTVDFARGEFNPLQLVFGWGERRPASGRVFVAVGRQARIVLARRNRRQDEVVFEGRPVDPFPPGGAIIVEVLFEGRLLGRRRLETNGPFFLAFGISPDYGLDRSLEFVLNASGPVEISSIRFR